MVYTIIVHMQAKEVSLESGDAGAIQGWRGVLLADDASQLTATLAFLAEWECYLQTAS